MIDLYYYWRKPNVWQITIFCEGAGVPSILFGEEQSAQR